MSFLINHQHIQSILIVAEKSNASKVGKYPKYKKYNTRRSQPVPPARLRRQDKAVSSALLRHSTLLLGASIDDNQAVTSRGPAKNIHMHKKQEKQTNYFQLCDKRTHINVMYIIYGREEM